MKDPLKFFRIFKKKKILFVAIVVLLTISFFLYKSMGANKDVKSTQVTKETIREELLLSGEVDADEKSRLTFQTSGRLSWVGIQEGDTVKKNQTLASLDTRDVQKNLEKQLNDYMKVRWDFEQTKDDNPDKALYSDEIKRIVEKSQFDLNNAVLDVEIQSLAKELSLLISPISGIVTRIDTPNAGVSVKITDTVEVVNPDTLYFRVNADQTEVTKIISGMNGNIMLDSYPDEKISGVVEDVSFVPDVNETGTVYVVKVKLESVNNSSLKYRIGMTGDITFLLQEKVDVVSIPAEFIKSDEKGSYVYVGKKKEKRYIKLGLEGDDFTEVTQGLNPGDIVYD
ncbi:MAG: efflux RND transporter periplasmic adaptor subunit [Candidatus Levybacteria bacterium]|nr:efflux RND transporter periplasmic adaptor subunit [Candidatus Levybacteria bacterium]